MTALRRAPFLLAAAVLCAASSAGAQTAPGDTPPAHIPRSTQQPVDPPAAVRPFVPAEYHAIAVDSADLDGDGRRDYLLLAEIGDSAAAAREENGRAILVLTRAADGTLSVAARSDRAVFCRDCGGMMGDPLQGVTVRHGGFTVHHYGGSGWRWSRSFTFSWSPEARTWMLKKDEGVSYHSAFPDKLKLTTRRAGRDFARVRLADFDAEAFVEP